MDLFIKRVGIKNDLYFKSNFKYLSINHYQSVKSGLQMKKVLKKFLLLDYKKLKNVDIFVFEKNCLVY